MALNEAFETACELLEREAGFDRLSARGTIRIALRDSGLDAAKVTPEQMKVVAERVLAKELVARGIPEPEALVARIAARLATMTSIVDADSPESIFGRLGGGRNSA